MIKCRQFLTDTPRLHYWSGDTSRIISESAYRFIQLIANLRHHLGFCLPYGRMGAPYIYIYIYIYIYDISSLKVNNLTLILLTWKKMVSS